MDAKKKCNFAQLTIKINGEIHHFDTDEITLDDILNQLKIDGSKVAIAINEVCIAKNQRKQQKIIDGDRVEIVSPMVGG